MPRVLIVEDERAIAESLAFALRRDGFEVYSAATLAAATQLLKEREAELVVLDLMLPDGSGFDLLAAIRASGQRLPVIILSSRDEEADRVAGLEGGADDYVVKPFSPREIVARVRAVLRRVRPLTGSLAAAAEAEPAPPVAVAGPPSSQSSALRVDAETRRASYAGVPLDLTRTEFDLLAGLLSAPERVWTRQQLLDRIFGAGYAVTDRTIDAHVKALRRKLAAAGADELIETERGVGYRLSAEPKKRA